jgi:hypothetical protein
METAKDVPPGLPESRPEFDPNTSQTQPHIVAATPAHLAIVQVSHTFPVTWDSLRSMWWEKTCLSVPMFKTEKLSTLCAIHLFMLATNQITVFCKSMRHQQQSFPNKGVTGQQVRKFSELFNASPIYCQHVPHYLQEETQFKILSTPTVLIRTHDRVRCTMVIHRQTTLRTDYVLRASMGTYKSTWCGGGGSFSTLMPSGYCMYHQV